MDPSDFVPIVAIFCLFGLPVIGWITIAVLRHRERMAMLQRGIVPPPNMRAWQRGRAQFENVPPPVWSQPGPAPVWTPQQQDDDSPQCLMSKGIKTAMVGLALLIGLSFIGYTGDGPFGTPTIHPGPWLLGGLIPMFVGVAQIIIALGSGAQFGLVRMPPSPPNQPPPTRPYGAAPPQPGTPGPRYEELARPVQPPDRQ